MASESWVVAGPQIIEIEAITSLRVQLAGGRVDVVAHDGPGARIEVHAVDGRPLEVSLSGTASSGSGYQFTLGGWDGLPGEVPQLPRQGPGRRAHRRAARGPRQGRHGDADGLLAGIEQDASVSTVSGTLITDGTRGRLGANTVSGEIVVRDHRGDLKLNSVSGELAASGELSLVQANSVSGSLTLRRDLRDVERHRDDRLRRRHRPAARRARACRSRAQSVSGRLVVDGEEYKGIVAGPPQGRPAHRRRRLLRLGQHGVRAPDGAARSRGTGVA